MAFDALPLELQNVLLSNHSYITKWLVFLTIIFLSSFYIFGVWKSHKQTKYITVAILRIFLFSLSFVYLMSSPLMLLLMTPEYSFYQFYSLPLIFYSIFMSIVFVLLFIDIFRYGFFVILKMAGLDTNDSNANEIANQILNNKHFIKWGRK